MRLNFDYSGIFMRAVIITQILYGFDQKNRFFEARSWFKFNNLRLVLGKALKFLHQYGKKFKTKIQKVLRKTSRDLFPRSRPPILNKVKNELTEFCPVKTIKKKKYRFHCFITCSVEVTCFITTITLLNMFGNIKSAVFSHREIGKGML